MNDAFICDAVRTPFGRYGGALSAIRTDDLATLPLKALLERNPGLDPKAIEDAWVQQYIRISGVINLEDQQIDWIDVLGKAGESRTKSLATEMIKEQLTKIEFDRMAAELAGTGKVPDLAAIEKDFSGPIGDAAGQMVDIVKLGSSTMKVSEKLEAIRKAISTVDDHVFTAEERWESAVNEMDLAHDSLNRCRDLHGAAGGQA